MITESELRERLIARVETSTTIKPQDLPMARNVCGAAHLSMVTCAVGHLHR
jgi:hypothetical protein